MRLPQFVIKPLARWAHRYMETHPVDRTIYARDDGPALLDKWRILDFLGVQVRLHELVKSDTDRHVHDHPWWNISIVLDGAFNEIVEAKIRYGGGLYSHGTKALRREAGDVIFRSARSRHRIVLDTHVKFWDDLPVLCENYKVVTLFIHGARTTRQWGFWDDDGQFTAAPPSEEDMLMADVHEWKTIAVSCPGPHGEGLKTFEDVTAAEALGWEVYATHMTAPEQSAYGPYILYFVLRR